MGHVEMEELRKLFSMTEKDAAKHLGVCLTSLKKIARGHGIQRWPFRKVKSLDRKLRKLDVVQGGARAGADGSAGEDAVWTSSLSSSSSSSGTHTPSSSEASIATTPRLTTKAGDSWASGRASPAAAAGGAVGPAPGPAHLPSSGVAYEELAGGGDAATPIELDDAHVLAACDELEPAARNGGEGGFSPCDLDIAEEGCAIVTPPGGGGALLPAALAGSEEDDSRHLRGGSPEPEPLTDEEIVAMLADCAGQVRSARSRGSHAPRPQADPKRLWEELPARGLSDVEIMSGLAQCAAEAREEEGDDGGAFLDMQVEADGHGHPHLQHPHHHADDLLDVADLLAVA